MKFQTSIARPSNKTRLLLFWIWGFLSVWCLAFGVCAASLEIEIVPRFNGAPLIFDALTNKTAAVQTISITRLDFLMSNFSVRRGDGVWVRLTNSFAYISAREGRT